MRYDKKENAILNSIFHFIGTLTISIRASKESDMHQLGFGQGESITLEVYLKEVNLGHSSVGNKEIVEHNYKFGHEEYLC